MNRPESTNPSEPERTTTGGEQFIRIPANYEVVVETNEPHSNSEFSRYLQDFWRRRWLILLICLSCLAIALYFAARSAPVYTATALMRVGVKTPKVQPYQEVTERVNGAPQNPVTTHINLLRSRPIVERTVARLNFTVPDLRIHDGNGFYRWMQHLLSSTRPATSVSVNPDLAQKYRNVTSFLQGLTVKPIPDTQIFQVSYSSPNPEFSQSAVNTLCETYVSYDFETKTGAYTDAERWLLEKLNDAREKLSQAEDALYQFTGTNGPEYASLVQNPQESLAEIKSLEDKIAVAERENRERQLNLKRADSGGIPDAMGASNSNSNVMIDKLRQELAAAEVECAKLSESRGPQDVTFKSAVAVRDRLDSQLQAELARLQKQARLALDQSAENLQQLRNARDQKQEQMAAMQRGLSKYNLLKREADINREMYNNLFQKWREIGVGQGIQPSDVSLQERAELPVAPSGKTRVRILLLGLALGLVLSAGLVLLLNRLDDRVRTEDEVWRLTRLDTIGRVARLPRTSGRQRPELISRDMPGSAIAESFRVLRGLVERLMNKERSTTLLVCSPTAGDGKTMVASNLALALAHRGRKVLLIDANWRSPALGNVFGLKEARGWAEAWASPDSPNVEDAAVIKTEIANLWILTVGSVNQNPSDLIDSDRLPDLLARYSGSYQHIIIDGLVADGADAGILASIADAVLIVVRPDHTRRRALSMTVAQLKAIGANILGTVINNSRKAYRTNPIRVAGSHQPGSVGRLNSHDIKSGSKVSDVQAIT